MPKNEYMKEFWQKPEVKEKKAQQQRELYATDEGQAYEKERRKTPKSRYARAKCNAKRRGKTFTITLEQYVELVVQNCYACNRSLESETGTGLDRDDNEKGYEPGNCLPCCSDCNRRRAKSMSAEEFKKQTELNGYLVKE